MSRNKRSKKVEIEAIEAAAGEELEVTEVEAAIEAGEELELVEAEAPQEEEAPKEEKPKKVKGVVKKPKAEAPKKDRAAQADKDPKDVQGPFQIFFM